jgi:hypothetical protein
MACGGSHHGPGNGGCCEMGEPASLLFDASARNDQHEHVESYSGTTDCAWTRRISSSREIGGAKRDLVIAQTRPAVCARIAVIIVIWICSVQGTVRALLLNESEHWLNLPLTTMSGNVPPIGMNRSPCAHRAIAASCLECNTVPKLKEIVRGSATSRGIRIGLGADDHVESVEQLLGMDMEEFAALILLRMDIWNSTCAPGAHMTLLNYGKCWQIDHKLFLGGVAKDDIDGKLARCVGWLQQPLPHQEHAKKSHGEVVRKSEVMIAAEQTDLANRVTEARAHVLTAQGIYGDNSENTTDSLSGLGDLLFEAELYDEAREVELVLRRIRVLTLGWDNPVTLRSCTRFGRVLAALGEHAAAMEVLDSAFSAHCEMHGRQEPRTLVVVDLMVRSLSELGDRNRVTKLLLDLTDEQMALRVPAKPFRKVRCRRGPVSVFAI